MSFSRGGLSGYEVRLNIPSSEGVLMRCRWEIARVVRGPRGMQWGRRSAGLFQYEDDVEGGGRGRVVSRTSTFLPCHSHSLPFPVPPSSIALTQKSHSTPPAPPNPPPCAPPQNATTLPVPPPTAFPSAGEISSGRRGGGRR